MTNAARIAFVCPLHGPDLPAGSARAAARYAWLLAQRHDVEVITTTAADDVLWSGELPRGVSMVDGVRVRRFPLDFRRDFAEHRALSERIENGNVDERLEQRWWRLQGPYSTPLIRHLEHTAHTFQRVILWDPRFATARYGAPAVRERAAVFAVVPSRVPSRLPGLMEIVRTAPWRLCPTRWEAEALAEMFPRTTWLATGIPALPKTGAAASAGPRSCDVLVLADGQLGLPAGAALRALGRWCAWREPRATLRVSGNSAHQTAAALGEPSTADVVDSLHSACRAGARVAVSLGGTRVLPDAELLCLARGIPLVVPETDGLLVALARESGAGLWYRDHGELLACLETLLDDAPLAGRLSRSGAAHRARTGSDNAVLDTLDKALGL